MRVLVISDTHGHAFALERVLKKHEDIETVLFLGDGVSDFSIVDGIEKRNVIAVQGNCDPPSDDLPVNRFFELEGNKIYMTHGHQHYVKYGLEPLLNAAYMRQADIVLYGHTHTPVCEYQEGLYIVNPGSLGRPHETPPSYAIIDFSKQGIMPNIIYL